MFGISGLDVVLLVALMGLLGLLLLYAVIRLAVRHALEDVRGSE